MKPSEIEKIVILVVHEIQKYILANEEFHFNKNEYCYSLRTYNLHNLPTEFKSMIFLEQQKKSENKEELNLFH